MDDLVLRLALQANVKCGLECDIDMLRRFASLVAAECGKVCEDLVDRGMNCNGPDCSKAIKEKFQCE